MTMTTEQIDDRTAILFSVDECACQRCGRSALGAASDPAWFIDTEMAPNPSVPDEPVSLALIYCPQCW